MNGSQRHDILLVGQAVGALANFAQIADIVVGQHAVLRKFLGGTSTDQGYWHSQTSHLTCELMDSSFPMTTAHDRAVLFVDLLGFACSL
ncbi:MAG: hypothetical protein ABIQ84_08115 [Usitatibacter sp.]